MESSEEMVRRARQEGEQAWDAWLWGATGTAVWDERGRNALRDDQALRQRARSAAADVSQVESEQFAWQAGRWGLYPPPAPPDGDLLKAALKSLGKGLLDNPQGSVPQTCLEPSSGSWIRVPRGDESGLDGFGMETTSDRPDNAVRCGEFIEELSASRPLNVVASSSRITVMDECSHCGQSFVNELAKESRSIQAGGQEDVGKNEADCSCRFLSRRLQQKREGSISSTRQVTWPHSFGNQSPILCSCLANLDTSKVLRNVRGKRHRNCSPVDRISDDVLMRVFSKLSRREVIAMSSVCRRWREVSSSEPLWRHVELASVADSLGDKELCHLADKRLKHTTVLSMALCWHVTSMGLASVVGSQCGKRLLCLDLSFCDFDDVTVNSVAENCSSLQRLRLFGARDTVSGQALAGLANLVHLRELDLGLCFNMSHHTLKEFGSKLKFLVILSLAGCPRVTIANLMYLCGCVSLEALCLVGCKSIYMYSAGDIAKELVFGGCSRLAMVEAGNQLPNAAPFPARPPPPPPVLFPANGVTFNGNGSPTYSPTFREAAENADHCVKVPVAEGGSKQQPIHQLQLQEEPFGEKTDSNGTKESSSVTVKATASQQFQQGRVELSGGNVKAPAISFQAEGHFNPSAAAYTFMAWMHRLAGADRSECVRECARAIFLDNDYGNPWNDVACELWDAGDTSLAAWFFQRAKACSRYEIGAGHFPYLNLAKLRLSENAPSVDIDDHRKSRSTPSKEALLELCAALLRAPGDEGLQHIVFHMLDDLRKSYCCLQRNGERLVT